MTIEVYRLGEVPFSEAFLMQKTWRDSVADGESSSALLLLQHPPVLTLGANFHEENLLLPRREYLNRGIEVIPTDRGGDVTLHNPGQLVAYPIFDLTGLKKDLHWWLRSLEEVMIVAFAKFGVEARRFAPHTGVWTGDKKIAAIGVKVKRWVSMHGLSINVNNNLEPFNWIYPCGIQEYGVTSLSQELGRDVTVDEVIPVLVESFRQVFELPFEERDWPT